MANFYTKVQVGKLGWKAVQRFEEVRGGSVEKNE
jgi:hypothetical protein